MNAPDPIKPATQPINLAHEVLLKADEALCVEEVARAILGGDKPTKACIKDAAKQLKKLADLGMIEMEPRAGGVPFYRLIAAPAVGDSEGGETDAPAVTFLAPEDYEMPPADPALLASANRMLGNRLEAIAEAIRASTIPSLEGITGAEDLAPHVKTLCDALAAAESTTTARGHTINQLRLEVADLRERLDAVTQQSIADTVAMTEKNTRLAADLEDMTRERDLLKAENLALKTSEGATPGFSAELATERQAREALQEQSDAVDVKDAAVGYLVRVPKRAPILRRKPESARSAALSAVRAGAARAEVLAVVPVGTARRGVEWQSTEAGGCK